jgi:hypothetical protein
MVLVLVLNTVSPIVYSVTGIVDDQDVLRLNLFNHFSQSVENALSRCFLAQKLDEVRVHGNFRSRGIRKTGLNIRQEMTALPLEERLAHSCPRGIRFFKRLIKELYIGFRKLQAELRVLILLNPHRQDVQGSRRNQSALLARAEWLARRFK